MKQKIVASLKNHEIEPIKLNAKDNYLSYFHDFW